MCTAIKNTRKGARTEHGPVLRTALSMERRLGSGIRSGIHIWQPFQRIKQLQGSTSECVPGNLHEHSGGAPKGLDDATGTSAIAIAHVELGETPDDGPRDGEARGVPTVATSGSASGAAAGEGLRDLARRHFRLRRCVEQRGEVPVHFITLTTAIYHWADLAQWLREYEERTTELRGGRQDPLEPGEDKVPEDKRRVLHHPGIVAWFCALKLELLVHYVRGYAPNS